VQELALTSIQGRPPVVLFLGAHCDDIEIGCGGTILQLRRQRHQRDPGRLPALPGRRGQGVLRGAQARAPARPDLHDEESLRAMRRLRGVESNAPERYTEAFHARKLVLVV